MIKLLKSNVEHAYISKITLGFLSFVTIIDKMYELDYSTSINKWFEKN